ERGQQIGRISGTRLVDTAGVAQPRCEVPVQVVVGTGFGFLGLRPGSSALGGQRLAEPVRQDRRAQAFCVDAISLAQLLVLAVELPHGVQRIGGTPLLRVARWVWARGARVTALLHEAPPAR